MRDGDLRAAGRGRCFVWVFRGLRRIAHVLDRPVTCAISCWATYIRAMIWGAMGQVPGAWQPPEMSDNTLFSLKSNSVMAHWAGQAATGADPWR